MPSGAHHRIGPSATAPAVCFAEEPTWNITVVGIGLTRSSTTGTAGAGSQLSGPAAPMRRRLSVGLRGPQIGKLRDDPIVISPLDRDRRRLGTPDRDGQAELHKRPLSRRER
jgi:hypothetical protein